MAEERVAMTVRLPKAVLQQAKQQNDSFNDLIIKTLEAEVVRRHSDDLLKRVDQHREQTLQVHRLLSGSAPLIRELRESR